MSVTNAQMTAMLAPQNQATKNLIKSYYTYDFIFASVASGANASAQIQIQSDSNFLVQAMSFFCWDLTANAQILAPYTTIQITLQSSGTTFYDQPVPIPNVFGTGQFPFILPEMRNLPPNSAVSASLVNVYSANAQYYALTLHGKKVFNLGS